MNCQNCETQNIEGAKFCVKCGATLGVQSAQASLEQTSVNNMQSNVVSGNTQINSANVNNIQDNNVVNNNVQFSQGEQINNQSNMINQSNGIQNTVNVQPSQNVQVNSQVQTVNNQNQMVNNKSGKALTLNFVMFIVGMLYKPIKTFKEKESELNNSKTALILALIMTGAMTVLNLIRTMVSVMRVRQYTFKDGLTYTWEFSNLSEVNYFDAIFKNFIVYAVIIFGIALIFFVGSKILKKNLDYFKSLIITTSSIIPTVAGVMILSPILGMISSHLAVVAAILGLMYSFVLLYELYNEEFKLSGEVKIYFNVACFSIILVVFYVIFMIVFMSTISGMFEMF